MIENFSQCKKLRFAAQIELINIFNRIMHYFLLLIKKMFWHKVKIITNSIDNGIKSSKTFLHECNVTRFEFYSFYKAEKSEFYQTLFFNTLK